MKIKSWNSDCNGTALIQLQFADYESQGVLKVPKLNFNNSPSTNSDHVNNIEKQSNRKQNIDLTLT